MTTLPEHPDANLRPASFQRTSKHGVYLCTLCPDLRTDCLSVVSLYVSPLLKKERLWQEPLRYPVSCTLQTLLRTTTKMIVPQRSNLSGICLKTSLVFSHCGRHGEMVGSYLSYLSISDKPEANVLAITKMGLE